MRDDRQSGSRGPSWISTNPPASGGNEGDVLVGRADRASLSERAAWRPSRARTLVPLALLIASGLHAGCQMASDLGSVHLTAREPAAAPKAGLVGAHAFRADQPRYHNRSRPIANATDAAPLDRPSLPVRSPEQASEGVGRVEAVVGGPGAVVPAGPSGATQEILIDQVVGQINGVPIYAAAFFEPMDARLRAEAAKVTNEREAREFIRSMVSEVARQLNDQMRNQLLIDEFRASLSAEERVGITALIERIRTDLQRGALGSRELADRQLMETEGRGLEQQARYLSDEVFIREHLNRTITRRISVSSRDVQQEYQRRWAEFNPPPVARLRVISVDGKGAARVSEELASGRPFTEVAAAHSRWRPDSGNLIEATLGEGGLAEAEFFGVPALNDPARGLRVGQSVGPIRLDESSVWWLHLDEIWQPPGKTLYDVQLELEQQIREARFEEERRRYFEGLLERSNFSDREEMVAKLTAFGARRYLGIQIPDTPQPGSDARPRW
jgi:hypothetical protein